MSTAHLARATAKVASPRARTLGGVERYRERTGWTPGLCTWAPCRASTVAGRLWCSPACSTAYRIANDTKFARAQVEHRDRGVCSTCGTDTRALARHLHSLARAVSLARFKRDPSGTWHQVDSPEAQDAARQLWDALRSAGVPVRPGETPTSQPPVLELPHLWEADHVQPVVKGGGGCGLDNLVTLCRACHGRKTRLARQETPA